MCFALLMMTSLIESLCEGTFDQLVWSGRLQHPGRQSTIRNVESGNLINENSRARGRQLWWLHIHVVCLIIAVVSTCMWLSLPLSSTLSSALSRVPRYRTFTPRWCSVEVRVAPSIGTAVCSRQSLSYHTHTHTGAAAELKISSETSCTW